MSNINDAIIRESFSRKKNDTAQEECDFELSADSEPGAKDSEFESNVVDGDFEAVDREQTGVSKKRILFLAVPIAFVAAAGAMYFASSNTSVEPDFAALRNSLATGAENASVQSSGGHLYSKAGEHGAVAVNENGAVAVGAVSALHHTEAPKTLETGATPQQQIIQPAIGPQVAAPLGPAILSAATSDVAVSPISTSGSASVETKSQAETAVIPSTAQSTPSQPTVAKREVATPQVSQVARPSVSTKAHAASQPDTGKNAIAVPAQPAPKKVVDNPTVSTQTSVAKKVTPADDSRSGIHATSDALTNDVKPLVTVTANQIGLQSLTKEAILINDGGSSRRYRVGDYLPDGDQLLFIDSQAATIVTDNKVIRVAY